MKKLYSILVVLALIFTSGIMLTACGDKDYDYHIPGNLEQYGLVNIYTGSGSISKDNMTFYFKFMENYHYDSTTMTVHFKNNKKQDVKVSDFVLDTNADLTEKIYKVSIYEPQEITITITGKAKLDSRTLKFDPTVNNGILTLDDEEAKLPELRLNFEIDGKSTGDLTFSQYVDMLNGTNDNNTGDNLLLQNSFELEYGSEITMSIWSTQHLSIFDQAVVFMGDDNLGRGDLDNWDHVILSEGGNTILKNTVTFNLNENLEVKFYLSNKHFEEAKFDTNREDIFSSGFLYMGKNDNVTIKIYDGNDDTQEIETFRELLSKNSVTIKVLDGSQRFSAGYIAKNIKENPNWEYKNFTLSLNGNTINSYQIEVSQRTDEIVGNEIDKEMYGLVFKNVPVSFPSGTNLFWNLNFNRRVEIFKITWDSFDQAMNDLFVELNMNCEYDESMYEYFDTEYCHQGLDNGLYFSGPYADTKYVLKDEVLSYYFQFSENAIGKKFKLSIGNESHEITLGNSEINDITFNDGKITLKYELSTAYSEDGIPTIFALGQAQDFTSQLKIEVVG